jgi:gamma-glutamyltranspeptidase/glutathione hydrolase
MEGRFPQSTVDKLASLGHPVERWADLVAAAGAVCAVMKDPATGWLHAGADPRREAYAIAW